MPDSWHGVCKGDLGSLARAVLAIFKIKAYICLARVSRAKKLLNSDIPGGQISLGILKTGRTLWKQTL